jgi:WhiB family redox-sensing transcriptional regulator
MTDINPIDLARPDWMQHAACRGMDAALFMPERGDIDTLNQAKAVCQTCHVRLECLEYGLEEKYGVWGGMAESARRKLRARRYQQTGIKHFRTRKPIEHGTVAGYHQHKRRREEPCESCRRANSINSMERKARREARNT